jgi:drug/metabolite transporter (DMT)-like permease
VLNVDLKNRSFLGPLQAVFKETGSWLMLIVSFLFSFSAVTGKAAIMHSSPMFSQIWFFIVLTVLLALILAGLGKIRATALTQKPAQAATLGVLMFLHIVCHGLAISMTKAAYMLSIKRLSILFSIIYGGLIFKEDNIVIRFAGAFLMFLGACLILLKAG